MSVRTETKKQFLSIENLQYLNSLTHCGAADLESFATNHLSNIVYTEDKWANVRMLNKLFLRFRQTGRIPDKNTLIIEAFMSPANRDKLQKFTNIDERAFLTRISSWASIDARDILENYDGINKSNLILKPSMNESLEMLNAEFKAGFGNDTEESFLMNEFISESLAPPNYESLNYGPNGTVYYGSKKPWQTAKHGASIQEQETNSYATDGNPINRFLIHKEEVGQKQRYNSIPFFNVYKRNDPEKDINETLGMGYTEFDTPLMSFDNARRVELARSRFLGKQ